MSSVDERLTRGVVSEVLNALEGHVFDWSSWASEVELQDEIEKALPPGPAIRRECELGHGDRPDFMVGPIALEVKVDGSLADLTRQVHRYAQHRAVSAVIVVTTRNHHRRLPTEIHGKPCRVFYLNPLR